MKEKKTYSLSEAAKEVIRLRDANLIDEVCRTKSYCRKVQNGRNNTAKINQGE